MKVSRNLFFSVLVACALPVVASEVVETPGVCSRVIAVASKATGLFTVPMDLIAAFVRADKMAIYLATPKEGVAAGRLVTFFANNQAITRRSIALVFTAGCVLAVYKGCKALTAQENVYADEYDFGTFGDEDLESGKKPE